MAAFSSKNGSASFDATAIPHARGWTLNLGSDEQQYASSGTSGFRSALAGHSFGSGSVTFYQDGTTDIEGILREGDTGSLTLLEDGSRTWTCPVLITSLEIETPIEDGAIVRGTINFTLTAAATAPT